MKLIRHQRLACRLTGEQFVSQIDFFLANETDPRHYYRRGCPQSKRFRLTIGFGLSILFILLTVPVEQ